MRRILSFVLVTLFAASLVIVAASSASAQDKGFVVFKGYVTAGMGQTTSEPEGGDSVSQFKGESQAQIEARGGTGNVTARYRLRVREGDKTLAAVRHNVTWKVTDQFELRFDGQGFGTNYSLNAYSAYTVGLFTDGMQHDLINDDVVLLVNVTGVDATFKAGALQFGAFLIDPSGGINILNTCTASSSTAADGTVTTTAATECQAIIPHFYGTFGNLRVAAYLVQAEAKLGDETNKADSMSVSGRWKAGTLDLAAEYVAGNNASIGDQDKQTNIGLGGDVGPIEFHYITKETESAADSANTKTVTEIAVGYMMPLTEKAKFFVGYGTKDTETKTSGSTSTDTVSELIAAVNTSW